MSATKNPNYRQWTVSATATSLTSILGLTNPLYIPNFVVRADMSNVGKIYWGKSNVTNAPTDAGGQIKPDEFYTFASVGDFLSTDDIFFVGTASDKAYFTLGNPNSGFRVFPS